MSPKAVTTATDDAEAPGAATPNKEGRYRVNLAPYYYLMAVIEAWLKDRSLPDELGSLVSAKLMEREPKRNEMLQFLAIRMGITKDQLVTGILDGTIARNLTYTSGVPPAPEAPEADMSDLIRDAQCGS